MGLWRSLVYSTIMSIIFLLLLELAFRWRVELELPPIAFEQLPGEMIRDESRGWVLKPGAPVTDPIRVSWESHQGLPSDTTGEVPISSLGLRDTELRPAPASGQLRILCLGDSSVWGSGVPRLLTFAERLEVDLSQGRPPGAVEVLNGGISGYSSTQTLLQLQDLLPLQLDAVVIYTMNSDRMDVRGYPDHEVFAMGATWLREVMDHSSLVKGLRALYRRLHPPEIRQEKRPRVDVGEFRSNLLHMLDLARSADIPRVVLVVPPLPPEPHGSATPTLDQVKQDPERFGQLVESIAAEAPSARPLGYQTAMLWVAVTENVPVVDGPRLFDEARQQHPGQFEGADALFVDLVHPSAGGHALLADAIKPHLQDLEPRRR